MCRDLIELRKNYWVPRREEEKAKTMQEVHTSYRNHFFFFMYVEDFP